MRTNVIGMVFCILVSTACSNTTNNYAQQNTPLIAIQEIPIVISPPVEDFIQKMIQEEHFTGVVLATKDQSIIHAAAYGKAQEGIPNKINTKFHVASITKQFTAAAIMQLVEQKKISLHHSINDYLPLHYRSNQWTNVTIHHLLTHTSGIQDYAVTQDYYQVEKGFCLGSTVDGMIKEAMPKELNFSPGSRFSYSNIGYTLLGQIIENRTKEPYSVYMKKHLFDPLNMTNSFIHTPTYQCAHDEAVGYRFDENLNQHVFDDIVSLPVTQPDGNLVTTLQDFLKWTHIYTDTTSRILSDQSITEMTTPHVPNSFSFRKAHNPRYGYGLNVTNGVLSHPGYIVGFRSHFIMDIHHNIRVFVFTNNVTNNPIHISSGIHTLLL